MRGFCVVIALGLPVVALAEPAPQRDYPSHVKPVIEQRCMVCHGCYDAPCQLKLDDWIGFERGANKDKVYDGTRLVAANLTRLYEDALAPQEWRDKGFYPVLERDEPRGGLVYKMLKLKESHPLPSTDGPLPESFDFRLDRNQVCANPEQFDQYRRERPYQGMPFGFPGLAPDELSVLA